MSLTNHNALISPSTFTNDSASGAKTKLNNNFALVNANVQAVSDSFDDALDTLFGAGWLVVPTISYSGSSLGITFGSGGKCLIGHEIVIPDGVATCLANQTGASLYFCQDGTWATGVPTTKSYMVAGIYSSNGSGITSWETSNSILKPSLITITDTVVINIPESPGYVIQYIDHSALGIFSIPGFVKLTVVPASDFTVELAYTGLIDSTSDTPTDPPQGETEEGFWFKITRKSGYYYSGNPDVTLTYARTGLGIEMV